MRSVKHNFTRKHFTYKVVDTGPILRHCPVCKGNYLIENKAGSVCANCHAVMHNPCRNCTSQNTHGLKGDNTQFIACKDCLFIE